MKNKIHQCIQDKENYIFQGISILCLVVSYIFVVYYMNAKATALLDSDEAAELILGKLVSESGGIFSDNWFYSTELRVLNNQIVYSLVFKLFNNWHIVRVVSLAILYLILLFSYWIFMVSIDMKRYYAITACILITPFSYEYFYFILKGGYYIPHISISLCALAVIELFNKSDTKYKKYIYGTLSFILALVSGMGGPRQIFILYLPIIVEYIILFILKRAYYIKNWCIYIGSFFFSIIGFLINNKILRKKYQFSDFLNSMQWKQPDTAREQTLLNGILASLGFHEGNLLGWDTVTNCISIVCFILMCIIFVIMIKRIKREREEVISASFRTKLYFYIALIMFLLLYSFTDLMYTNRYNIPILIFLIPIIAIFIDEINSIHIYKKIGIIAFTIALMLSGAVVYQSRWNWDATEELRTISDCLQKEGYYSGYATYWNSNVLYELSDSKVDVWCWCDGYYIDELNDIDSVYHFSQIRNHETERPQGKLFVLLTKEEYEKFFLKDMLESEKIIYESDSFVIFGYSSYDELNEAVQ